MENKKNNRSSSSNNGENKSLLFLKKLFTPSTVSTRDIADAASTASNNNSLSADSRQLPLPNLSPLANSVISRCSKILNISIEELQHQFDAELLDTVKQSSPFGRIFLEFCSYRALQLATARSDYLSDKEFRRLTFDMMLAWEAAAVDSEPLSSETDCSSSKEVEDEDGWSLFYSNSTKMAVQVDDKKTVGLEAFARIAPACAVAADIITVHNLFDVLTSSSNQRLHLLIYDKYLRSLEKVIKSAQNAVGQQMASNLSLAEEEIILDVDGTVPTQPVLQHLGISAWPGRLTLTNYALYFESGVGLYDKAVRYDLSTDMKQVIKPELTGPLGARLFDKAVMYKSQYIAEPVYLEFPEFKGSSRRDYWLDICLEILRAHRFIRKYNLKGNQRSEALSMAILGIFRYRAVRESFNMVISNYKALLCFNLAETLPGGDMILETLSNRLALMNPGIVACDSSSSPIAKGHILPAALLTLSRLRILHKEAGIAAEAARQVDVCAGEISPLETLVKQLKHDTGRAEAAQATVNQVKVEGIDTNLAVLKELLFPLIETFHRLQVLASWEQPLKSAVFLVLISYIISRGWISYILPFGFVVLAVVVFCRSYANKGRPLEAVKITAPPSKNAVEQLLTLQEVVSQAEALIQSTNIILLKARALVLAAVPRAADMVALVLVLAAVAFVVIPLKYLMLFAFLESFTRNMPLRKDSADRWMRRMREWWIRIPAAPVQLIKPDDKKTK